MWPSWSLTACADFRTVDTFPQLRSPWGTVLCHFLHHLLFFSSSAAISEGHSPTDVSLLAASPLHKVVALSPYQAADLVPCSATWTVVPAQLKWPERGAGSQTCRGSTGRLASSSRVPGWLYRLVLKYPLPVTLCTPVGIGSIACFPKDNTESHLSGSFAWVLDKLK